MNKIIVVNRTQNKNTGEAVRKIIERSLILLRKINILMDVYLVNDDEMKKINGKWRKKNKATNVLTFKEVGNFPHPEFRSQMSDVRGQMSHTKYLGELYLAPHYIKIKKEDMKLMVVHGLLHLLGYTHTRKSDTIRMETMEKKLMSDFQ